MPEPSAGSGLAEQLRSLRHGVDRHRRLLAAGLAAAAVAAGIGAAAPDPPQRIAVLAAAHDLPAGEHLASDDLTTLQLRSEAVPKGALRPSAHVDGRLLAGPLRRGEPLTDVRLLGPGLLAHVGAPGLVATPVRISDAAAAQLLHPGDRVDVLAADPDPPGGTAATADGQEGPAADGPAGHSHAGGESAGGAPAGGAGTGGAAASAEHSPAGDSSGAMSRDAGGAGSQGSDGTGVQGNRGPGPSGADVAGSSSVAGATVVASNVRVLTVPPASVDATGGALVLLAATPDVASRLAAAQVQARLSVTVRPRADAKEAP